MAPADDIRSNAVFRMRGVSKIYRMGEIEVRALDNVDLDLYRAEFVVLLGDPIEPTREFVDSTEAWERAERLRAALDALDKEADHE